MLILLIDDFNQKDPDILVRVVRALEKFVAPKILLVISALGDAWRKAVTGVNKSAEQKIQIFGDPIIVTPPSAEQILELFTKLHSLIVVSTNWCDNLSTN